jgi:ADP-ribose pyrophosphatase YjhB (NUDIX family)
VITFTRGNVRFNYRIAGVIIHDGKVLLQKPVKDGFWFLPGGRAELQETADETLKREMREEMHTDITVERLLWVVENFFEHGDKAFHELGLYFLMSFPKDSAMIDTDQTFFVQQARASFPFPILGLDTDNGSEFINELLLTYCEQEDSGVRATIGSGSDEAMRSLVV